MPIDFHAEENRYTYATRQVDQSWRRLIISLVDPSGKVVLDIGCGGGIYSRAWSELGASAVIGVDFSEQMVKTAAERSVGFTGLSFRVGDALATGLSDQCADVVFERALIHHLPELRPGLFEAHRLLKPGGAVLIQDRTPADGQLPGTPEHIRGFIFERFPHLLAVENARRRSIPQVQTHLEQVGFTEIKTLSFWETRRTYPAFKALADDLKQRVGRSILHELSDADLDDLAAYIAEKVPLDQPLTEKSRWTIWYGVRRSNA